MKVAVFVVGLVLLLVGLLGAAYGWFTATGLETSHALLCTVGNPEPFPGWCAGLLSAASNYRTLGYVMLGVFVVGLALTVWGAVMPETTATAAPGMAMPLQPAPPPNPWRTCKNCGRSMPSTDRFCPSCGTAQW